VNFDLTRCNSLPVMLSSWHRIPR